MTASVERRDDGAVVRLTVAREAKLNALNGAMIDALTRHLADLAAADEGVRAVVIAGAGDRAFVGGADIGEMAALNSGDGPTGAAAFISRLHGLMTAVRAVPVPVIARIQGHCLGGGMELAAACDIRVASEAAVFGMPEVRVGLPSVIEAALLPGLIGWGRTRWLLMTGETIDARTAYEWGFVEQLAPAADLDAALGRTLDAIQAAGPHAVRTQKALIRQWEAMTPDHAAEASIPVFAAAFETGEPQAMLGGFLNRRLEKRGGKD